MKLDHNKRCFTSIKSSLASSYQCNRNSFNISLPLQLLFWDIRLKPERRGTPPRAPATPTRGATPPLEEWTWSPVFEIKLDRTDESGHLGGVRVELSRLAAGGTQFFCGSEVGSGLNPESRNF